MSGKVGEAFRPPATVLPPLLPARRRNRLDLEVYREPGQFFITINTQASKPHFADADVAVHCIDELRAACSREGFALVAFCFMPDHVHMLVDSDREGADVTRLIKDFKQRTGWWFRHRGRAGGLKASPTLKGVVPSLWQKSYYDHVLRQDEDPDPVVQYIVQNPVVAGIVDDATAYPFGWSSYDWPEAGEPYARKGRGG